MLEHRPLVVDLIDLTLTRRVFHVRPAHDPDEEESTLAEWHPHLAVVDMDHANSTALIERLDAAIVPRSSAPLVP